MTQQRTASTWREAYDAAREELALPEYRGWAWASVRKCTPDACGNDDCPRDWVAEIA